MKKNTLPCWRRGLLLALLCLGTAALAAQTPVPIKNPTFADTDGDGVPDNWKIYPAYDGVSVVPGGGIRLNDQSTTRGLGVAQWLPATEGTRYRATIELQGTGGVFVYLIFTPGIPGKEAEVDKIKLLEKRQWASAKAQKSSVSIDATAPAGATNLRLWIYSPNASVADAIISSVKLDSLGAVALSPAAAATGAPAAAPASQATPSAPVPQGNLLQNPTFADTDGDGTPDGWNPFPPGDGASRVLAPAPGGGLVFKDNDKNNGLGLEQWVPVQAGLRYAASAGATGSGGLRLSLVFAGEKPAKAGDLDKVQLAEKSAYLSGGKSVEVAAIAPAGARWMKVWLYCPKVGIADVVIPRVTLSASAAAGLPSGLVSLINFETGDFSQAQSTEGGAVSVITAAEGPVREGRYAFKAAVKKNQHRAEVTGPRCPPYGIARYGWSLYVPKEFDAETFFSIITQWHDWGTGRQSPPDGGPPTSISVSHGKVSLKVHYQGDDGWTTKKQYLPVCGIEDLRGRWSDWVMEANWQPPGKGGWLKLYLDGKLVVDYKGTTFYEDKDKGPYFKFGCYKGGSSWKGTEEGAVLYFDSFRMALGPDSTYRMVDPAAYAPRPAK